MLSKELEFSLNQAFKRARERRHEFLTVEHLLLALLDTPAAVEVLKACGADLARLRRDLEAFVQETTPLLPDDEKRDTHRVDVLAIHERADTIECDMVAGFAETAEIDLDLDGADAVLLVSRAATDADWPPAPRIPADRPYRRASMLRAITSSSLSS